MKSSVAMTQELEKTKKLAEKNTRATAFLTFFMPLLGYIYTGRYKAMLMSLGMFVGVTGICVAGDLELDETEDLTLALQVLYGVGTAVENSRAVSQAKRRLQEQKFKTINPTAEQQKIQLLRLAKTQGEVTLADCVLEINSPAAEVRQLLKELQQEDLMIVGNRETDGAVVYRII
ncbi:hypothetical protein ACL6C3_09510 [Capilliphycus salinus ALCB114379]|uniref:hypothetical protein n=1 Tax=Capilliphycus salinus TaxID=2768948 RepID=UPI0039A5F5BE